MTGKNGSERGNGQGVEKPAVGGVRGLWQQFTESDRRWLGWAIMVALIVAGTLLGVQFPALPPMPGEVPAVRKLRAQEVWGQYRNFSGLVIAGPTTFATATPGTILNTDGLGKILELQDAGTPVASFSDGGAIDFDQAFNVDGAVTLNSSLDVDGNITSGTGGITITDSVLITGAVVLNSTAEINGDVTLENDEVVSNGTDTVISMSAFLAFAEASVAVVAEGLPITPTGSYTPITSTAAVTTSTSSAIADGVVNGQLLVLVNENASDAIIIDDGANTKLGGNKTLTGGEGDAIWLIWDGADWLCIGYNDN